MSIKEQVENVFQLNVPILGFAVFAPRVVTATAQSIEEYLPVEGPACGMTCQHRDVSAVAVAPFDPVDDS